MEAKFPSFPGAVTSPDLGLGKEAILKAIQWAMAALRVSECVDLPLQLSGVDQAPQDVVVEVPEPQGDPTQVPEPAVDSLNRPVRRTDIEVGEHVLASAPQGAPQLGELLQTCG